MINKGATQHFSQGPTETCLSDRARAARLQATRKLLKVFLFFFFFWMPALPVCHCLSLRLWASLYCLCQMWAGGFCLHSLSPSCQALTDKASAPRQSPLLRLRWLFLDSVPPLISSSEICLREIGGWVGGWGWGWRFGSGGGVEGWGGARKSGRRRMCLEERRVNGYHGSWQWQTV